MARRFSMFSSPIEHHSANREARFTQRGERQKRVIDRAQRRARGDDDRESNALYKIEHQVALVERHHHSARAFDNPSPVRRRCRQFERIESDSNSCLRAPPDAAKPADKIEIVPKGAGLPKLPTMRAPIRDRCLRWRPSARVSNTRRPVRRRGVRRERFFPRSCPCRSRNSRSSGNGNRVRS